MVLSEFEPRGKIREKNECAVINFVQSFALSYSYILI